MDRRHLVLEQDLDAGLFRRGVERLHQAVAGRHGRAHPPGRPACRSAPAANPSPRSASRAAPSCRPNCRRSLSGALSTKTTPCASSNSKVAAQLSAKARIDLAVVVAIIGKAVRLDHRPVGQVAEQQVGRIVDAVFLLHAGAAAQRHIAAAADGVAADMVLRLDHDDRRAAPRARRWRPAARRRPSRSRPRRPHDPSEWHWFAPAPARTVRPPPFRLRCRRLRSASRVV